MITKFTIVELVGMQDQQDGRSLASTTRQSVWKATKLPLEDKLMSNQAKRDSSLELAWLRREVSSMTSDHRLVHVHLVVLG